MQSIIGALLMLSLIVGVTYGHHVLSVKAELVVITVSPKFHKPRVKPTARRVRPTEPTEGQTYQTYESIDYSPSWATCPNAHCNPRY
jgi:hypothetical protein